MIEKEIRPLYFFHKYLALSKKDISKFKFKNNLKINCPACKNSKSNFEMKKNKFKYYSCSICKSLYLNPRPNSKDLKSFYANSDSAKYWANVFFPRVLQNRIKKIFVPRYLKIQKILNRLNFKPKSVCEIGAGHGIFLDQIKNNTNIKKLYAIEPNKDMSKILRDKKFIVFEKLIENITKTSFVDFAVSFEVFEHIYDPNKFLKSVYKILKKKGIFIMTTLTVDGFDINYLGKKSKSISPPHHLNFLSIEGFKSIFDNNNFEIINIFTPGKLDTDIVKNTLSSKEIQKDKFLSKIFSNSSIEKSFQRFLSNNCLSSHVWIVARKR